MNGTMNGHTNGHTNEHINGNIPQTKACTAKKGICYCENCSPGRTKRAQQLKTLLQTPIFRLPPEMLDNILERVDLVDFPPLVIACYHLFRMRGIAPAYPTSMLRMLLLRGDETDTRLCSLQGMPQELLLAIGQTLNPNEKIHMTLATYRMTDEHVELITRGR
ncbi:MAG: hypothetical protein Q9224_003808 [Gallowayella concinna]